MKERTAFSTRGQAGSGHRRGPATPRARGRSVRRGARRHVLAVMPVIALLIGLLPALASAAVAGDPGNAPLSLAAQAGQASITLDVLQCPSTTGSWEDAQARTNDDLAASCTKPLANVTAHLTATATGQDTPMTSGGDGAIAFDALQPGSYTLYTGIPRGTAWEVAYCSVDGGAPYQKTFNESLVTTFSDLDTEQVVCSWYVVPVDAATTMPTAATATTPAAAPTETPAAGSSTEADTGVITVDAFTCPADATLDGDSSFQALDSTCTSSSPGVTVHLVNADTGTDRSQNTGAGGLMRWDALDPGTYNAYSDIPRDTARELLYCSDRSGTIAPVAFNDNVVATLQLAAGERFDCSWFILPDGTSGAGVSTANPLPTLPATGAPTDVIAPTETPTATSVPTETLVPTAVSATSLTVHLSLCPMDYTHGDYYNDCHANGIDGMEFLLDGPDGQLSATTTLPETPGPGVVTFANLSGGDYSLAGGPPGDFGHVVLYCTTQPDGTRIDAPVSSTQASLTIEAGTDVLCDWYYIPEDARGETPTPTVTATTTATLAPTMPPTATPSPTVAPRAEILVTLYRCPAPGAGSTYGGATYDDLRGACGSTVDEVPFSLGDVGAPPLVANTGISGPGAVRFYDLLPADYTLAPSLPSSLTSTAVFCSLEGGNRYQKALQNGGVVFMNVESEHIACDWFAVAAPQPTPTPPPVTAAPSQPTPTAVLAGPVGPVGSVTVREYLCAKDKSAITDWERECTPGTSGETFILSNPQLGVSLESQPEKNGVLVFARLKDGHYTLKQQSGAWCRATADRVDSESRVIVADGANTDVVIYQCNATTSLPSTGTGTQISSNDRNTVVTFAVLALVLVSASLAAMSVVTFVRTERRRRRLDIPRENVGVPVRTESGRMRMRFR